MLTISLDDFFLKFTYLAFLLVSCLPDRFKLAVLISFLDAKHWEGFILLFFWVGVGSWWKSHELRMMQENTWKRLVHCISVCGTLILKILPSFIHLFNMWSGHLLWLGTLSYAEDTDEKKADKVLGRRRQSISREPRLVWRVTCFFYL